MKQLSTKSIGSLLTAIAQTVGDAGKQAGEKHLERILQRHDRKCELRASILGVRPLDLRNALQHRTFDEIVRMYGFKNREGFKTALRGKLRSELAHRGWSRQKIDMYVNQKTVVAV